MLYREFVKAFSPYTEYSLEEFGFFLIVLGDDE
jgi:hypothetical protein